MAQQAQQAMANMGSALSWNDIEEEERRAEGRPFRRRESPRAEPPFEHDLSFLEPRVPFPLYSEGVEEDLATARRHSWMTSDEGPSGRFLFASAVLVVVVVVALVAITLIG